MSQIAELGKFCTDLLLLRKLLLTLLQKLHFPLKMDQCEDQQTAQQFPVLSHLFHLFSPLLKIFVAHYIIANKRLVSLVKSVSDKWYFYMIRNYIKFDH